MTLVELGGSVQTHARPHRLQELPQRTGAQAMVGVLQDLGVVIKPPHHQVRLGAEARHVIETADFCARALHVVQGFSNNMGALAIICRQELTQCKHGIQRVVLLAVDLVQVNIGPVARVGNVGVRGVVVRSMLSNVFGRSLRVSAIFGIFSGLCRTTVQERH